MTAISWSQLENPESKKFEGHPQLHEMVANVYWQGYKFCYLHLNDFLVAHNFSFVFFFFTSQCMQFFFQIYSHFINIHVVLYAETLSYIVKVKIKSKLTKIIIFF